MISVRGEQYYDGADPDSTELMTEGTLESSEIKIAPSVLLQSGMLEQFDTHE